MNEMSSHETATNNKTISPTTTIHLTMEWRSRSPLSLGTPHHTPTAYVRTTANTPVGAVRD